MIPNVSPTASSSLDSSSSVDRSPPTVLHVSFNQDSRWFAAGTDLGFRIYSCDPFREFCRRDFDAAGGIGIVEMRSLSDIFALVGGEGNPQYPLNKVVLWDNHMGRRVSEISLRSDVRGVRLRRDFVVVVLQQKILVYHIADLGPLNNFATIANPKGLCAVSDSARSFVLVCPGLQNGQVRVEHYSPRRATKIIPAHESAIACLALSLDGQWLATASQKGTLVRIFNTQDGTLVQEVRRGADRAEIYNLAFSSSAQWLAVSSGKGTVHVFGLKTTESPTSSPGLLLGLVRGVLPKYLSSEWSVAQFRLPEGSTRYVVGFGHQKNTVVILGWDGSFYRCKFDPVTGGEMTLMEYHNFLKPNESL